jgi:hypothetical protein
VSAEEYCPVFLLRLIDVVSKYVVSIYSAPTSVGVFHYLLRREYCGVLSLLETGDMSIKQAVANLQRLVKMVCHSDTYSKVESYMDLEICATWKINVVKRHFFTRILHKGGTSCRESQEIRNQMKVLNRPTSIHDASPE